MANLVLVGFFLDKKIQGFEFLNDLFPGFFHRKTLVSVWNIRAQGPIGVQNVNLREAMTPSHVKIVLIVGGGDLHRTGSELPIHEGISHQGDFPIGNGQLQHFPGFAKVPLVFGMDRHRSVTNQGFRPGGGQFYPPTPVGEGITDMVEMTGNFFKFHFIIGDGGLGFGIPIH